jgi:hypothetical protein
LLYTNRQLHYEASHAFYRSNYFVLESALEDRNQYRERELLQSFIDGIGPTNAASMGYIAIRFPFIERVAGEPGQVSFSEDRLQSLQLLQHTFTWLKTLELVVCRDNAVQDEKADNGLILEVLRAIKRQLEAMASLRKIVGRLWRPGVVGRRICYLARLVTVRHESRPKYV